jgi:hypothetical protein
MLLGEVFFRENTLELRGVDGSEVGIPLQDAQELLDWLQAHAGELQDRLREALEQYDVEHPLRDE